MENIVLIPAYNPDNNLIELVNELKAETDYKIIIVNDGSSQNISANVFNICSNFSTIISHTNNLGKGQAIKSGLKYIYENFHENSNIITVDADGQHKVCDIIKIINAAALTNDCLILGSRCFTGSIPLRSKLGNNFTRLIFAIATHKKLIDTQTGLRCFSYKLIPTLLKIKGSRYEYEMNMLLEMINKNIPIKEIKIETIYFNDNSSSHFHIMRDSYLIYKDLISFSFSSIISFFIDFILYSIITAITNSVTMGNLCARAISSTVNFNINRTFVFKSKENTKLKALKYFSLVLILIAINTLLLNILVTYVCSNKYICKVIVELFLFLTNWVIQKTFIFKSKVTKVA